VVGEGGVAARTTTEGEGNEARQGARNNQTIKQRIQARQRGPITNWSSFALDFGLLKVHPKLQQSFVRILFY
jgi:hypothetical protein